MRVWLAFSRLDSPTRFSETFVYLGCMRFREWKLENTILLFGTIAWYMYACFTKWCGVCRVWCRRVLESKGNGGPCCDNFVDKKELLAQPNRVPMSAIYASM